MRNGTTTGEALAGELRSRNGFVLIVTCLSLVVLTGIAGVAVDVGRMYIGKNELQSFADAAAIAAALQLDGTTAGITRAQTAVSNTATGTNAIKWDMGTKTVSNISTTFGIGLGNNPDKPDPTSWTASPNPATNYRFVKVVATAAVPSIFMQAFQALINSTAPSTNNVVSQGVAGQVLLTTFPVGLLPFSPIAPLPANPPDWGFTQGTQYTIRYPTPNSGNVCAGDVGQTYWNNLPSQDRGYWGTNSASAIRGEIIDDTEYSVINIGQPVPMVGGAKTTEGAALAARVLEDSDSTSATYAAYMSAGNGNGRRLVGLPINNGPNYDPQFVAIGIGEFFLLTPDIYNAVTGNTPICAEYVGPFVQGSYYSGTGDGLNSDTGGYLVRLVQ